jgi:hypothetical protein
MKRTFSFPNCKALEQFHSLVVVEMEIVSRCIDKELNALAMDSQRMTKDNILL